MTPYGEGILVGVNTAFNGLCISYEKTDCEVWFGSENPGISDNGHGRWISRKISLEELINLNIYLIRDEKLTEIGI